MGWQTSAVQMAGIAKQLKAQGIEAKVLARCSAQTVAIMRDPFLQKWHPSSALIEVSEAIDAELGHEGFEQLNYEMTRASFGPIVRPMLQVALAITGRSPSTVLARLPSGATQALQNVTITYRAKSERSAELLFEYPTPVKGSTEFAWRGALRFLAELAGSPCRISPATFNAASTSLTFTVDW